MEQVDLQRYQKKLEEGRKKLIVRLAELGKQADEVRDEEQPNGYKGDFADNASLSVTVFNKVLSDTTNALAAHEAALGRIKEGTFGRCQKCGDDIDQKRLNKSPEVPFCIECQSLMEQKKRRAIKQHSHPVAADAMM